MCKIGCLVGLLMVFTSPSFAQSPASAGKKEPVIKAKILDFEGEVIEGERQRPDLFLQLSSGEDFGGDLIYIRQNFNDFLEVDQQVRPQFIKTK